MVVLTRKADHFDAFCAMVGFILWKLCGVGCPSRHILGGYLKSLPTDSRQIFFN